MDKIKAKASRVVAIMSRIAGKTTRIVCDEFEKGFNDKDDASFIDDIVNDKGIDKDVSAELNIINERLRIIRELKDKKKEEA